MLTREQIESNKQRFIELISSIDRQGANIDKLIKKLENSDFFTAPASTKYHGSFEGGLCAHSLDVYDNLCKLVDMYKDTSINNIEDDFPKESLIIVALLHDMSKMNFYTTTFRNKKVYKENGSKRDEGGRFDWEVEKGYAVIPEEERFIYGNHEQTSEFMVRQYIPLTHIESAAILHHHFSMSNDCVPIGVTGSIMQRYPLALLLHTADMLAAFITKV